jgi:uncharacterized membrane protein YukC
MGVGAGVGTAIVILIIIIIVVTYFMYVKGEEQKALDKGCTPAAWGQYGIVTIWDCPAGVKLG